MGKKSIIDYNFLMYVLYCLAFLSFLSAYTFVQFNHGRRSLCSIVFCFVMLDIAFFLRFFHGNNVKKKTFFIYVMVLVLWNILYINSTNPNIVVVISGEISFIIPILLVIVECFRKKYISKYIKIVLSSISEIKSKLFEKAGMIILLLIFAALSYETLDTAIVLDADIFFHAFEGLRDFDFTFYTIDSLKLGGHLSFAYSVIYGCIYFIAPNTAVLLRLVNILIAMISTVALDYIITRINPNLTKMTRLLLCAAYLFNPIIMGLIYDLNLDLFCSSIFILFIAAYLKRDSECILLTSFMLVFSKEIGIVLLLGFLVGVLILYVDKRNNIKLREMFYLAPVVVPTMFFLLFMLAGKLWRQRSILGNKQSKMDGVVLMDSIQLYSVNVITKLKELFLINFSWVVWLLFAISLGVCIYHYLKKKRNILNKKCYIPIVCSMFFFILFNILYVTYVHMRYIIPFVFFSVICLCLVLQALENRFRYSILTILTILMLVENFITIDPITRNVFDNVDVGNCNIISTRTFIRSGDNSVTLYKDRKPFSYSFMLTQSAQYNRQYMYKSELVERILEKINYDENDVIYVLPCYEEAIGMTWNCLFGKWYTDTLYYDESYRLVEENKLAAKPINIVIGEPDIVDTGYENVYVVSFDYNRNYDVHEVLQRYAFVDSKIVTYRGWTAEVSRLR